MTKEFALQRLLDYLRMECDCGYIAPYSPLGIAWTDYKIAARDADANIAIQQGSVLDPTAPAATLNRYSNALLIHKEYVAWGEGRADGYHGVFFEEWCQAQVPARWGR